MSTLIHTKLRRHSAAEIGHSPMGTATLDGGLGRLRRGVGRFAKRLGTTLNRLKQAASRPAQPPLVLELDHRVVRFYEPDTFEFALLPRTQFPATRVARLIDWPAEELERVAMKIRQVEKRFAEAVATSVERPRIVGHLLRRMDLKLFTHDHNWREIIAALNRYDSGYDDYKKIALVKYTQYLRARQQILRSLYLEKRGAICNPKTEVSRKNKEEDTRMAASRDTGVFESTLFDAAHQRETFAPLPRGETICLRFTDSPELTLRLSAHSFKLVAGKYFYLVDDQGANYLVRPGKNIVGRHAGCDVVLDPVYRGVSRKHLIIEPVSETVALVTDISSHGTYVPEKFS